MEKGQLVIIIGLLTLSMLFFSYSGGVSAQRCYRNYHDCVPSIPGCDTKSYRVGCQQCSTIADCSNLRCGFNEVEACDVSGVGSQGVVADQQKHHCACLPARQKTFHSIFSLSNNLE